MIGHGASPYLSLDKIESSSPMIITIIISYLFNRTFWVKLKPISVRIFYWCLINSTLCYYFYIDLI